jgi:O-antigen ligase
MKNSLHEILSNRDGLGRSARSVMFGAMYCFVASMFFSIAVNSISLSLMGIGFLLLVILDPANKVTRTPLDWFFAAYVVVELLTMTFSYKPLQAFEFSKRLLLIGIVYWFATWIVMRSQAKTVMVVLIGSAAIVGLIGVGIEIIEKPLRLGIFQFYMTTSELLMLAGLIALPFAVHPGTPRSVRWAVSIALIPILFALYATVTKGAYLAFAAGVIFIAAVRNWKLVVPLAAVIVVILVFAPPYVQNRLEGIVDIHHPENASRLALWKTGLRIFAAHPITGVGDADLHDIYVQYMDPGDPTEYGHLHNVAMQFLVTLGLPGFMVVLAMFVQIFRTEWRIYRRVSGDWLGGSIALGGLAAFVGLHVAGLTEWTFGDQELAVLFWTTVGMTLAVGSMPGSGAQETSWPV